MAKEQTSRFPNVLLKVVLNGNNVVEIITLVKPYHYILCCMVCNMVYLYYGCLHVQHLLTTSLSGELGREPGSPFFVGVFASFLGN